MEWIMKLRYTTSGENDIFFTNMFEFQKIILSLPLKENLSFAMLSCKAQS